MKIKNMVLSIIFVLFVVLGSICISYGLYKKAIIDYETKNNELDDSYYNFYVDKYYYTLNNFRTKILFYKWDSEKDAYKKINEFKGKDIYVRDSNLKEGKILFFDSKEEYILFDFETGEKDIFSSINETYAHYNYDGYYKIKENGLWRLYNVNSDLSEITLGYQDIFYVTWGVVLVQQNDKLYIKSIYNYDLTDNTIPVYMDYNYDMSSVCKGIYFFDTYDDKVYVTVDTKNSDKCYGASLDISDGDYERYVFDTLNKELKKLT